MGCTSAKNKFSAFGLHHLCSRIGSGFSAVGSAHVWGARGRWFESSNPDRKKIQTADYQQFGFLLCSKLACFWRASYCFGVP